jgi:hypothetical protein
LTYGEYLRGAFCVSLSKYCAYFSVHLATEMHHWQGIRCESDARPVMDIDRAKWFLRVFTAGKKLNTLTIRELYLSGYIGIELHSPGKEPLPTVITEKGKQVLGT